MLANSYGFIFDDNPQTVQRLTLELNARNRKYEIFDTMPGLYDAVLDRKEKHEAPPDWIVVDMHVDQAPPDFTLMDRKDVKNEKDADAGKNFLEKLLLPQDFLAKTAFVATSTYDGTYQEDVDRMRLEGGLVSYLPKKTLEVEKLDGTVIDLLEKPAVARQVAGTVELERPAMRDLDPDQYMRLLRRVADMLGYSNNERSRMLALGGVLSDAQVLSEIRRSPDVRLRIRKMMDVAFRLSLFRSIESMPEFVRDEPLLSDNRTIEWAITSGDIDDLYAVLYALETITGGAA
jgi:hypothetical protein